MASPHRRYSSSESSPSSSDEPRYGHGILGNLVHAAKHVVNLGANGINNVGRNLLSIGGQAVQLLGNGLGGGVQVLANAAAHIDPHLGGLAQKVDHVAQDGEEVVHNADEHVAKAALHVVTGLTGAAQKLGSSIAYGLSQHDSSSSRSY